MIAADLRAALGPVLAALRGLGVRHYVGGSIASSAHGVPRASIGADVVAELEPRHAAPFVAALRGAYYVAEERVRDAVARRRSFNLIHLETMVKVDVFVSRDRPFDRRAFDHVRPPAPVGKRRSRFARPRTRSSPSWSGSGGAARCRSGGGRTSWGSSGPAGPWTGRP
ncbi:MAG TPA: hypothetical protein VGB87_21715 [Vicinamibacteria bacterium]